MGTPWAEKESLLAQGCWSEPGSSYDEGVDLVGSCIYVMGMGKGTVLAFNRAKIGASSHTVDFGADGGATTKVTLERKGNSKTPYLVLKDPAAGGNPIGKDDGDGGGVGDGGGGEGSAIAAVDTATELPSSELPAGLDGRPLTDEDDDDDSRDDVDDDDDDDDDDGTDDYDDETDDEDIALLPKRSQSIEWEGIDDPGYMR